MSDLTILEDNILPIPLSDLEKHQLAMNIVGKELEVENYEFLSVNSQLKKILNLFVQKKKNYLS
jgi:hypothetical protein